MVSWDTLHKCFLLNGAVNIVGMLIFNKGFSNQLLTTNYPEIFSTEGMLGIMLWGAAYLAASPSLKAGREKQPYTYAVFCAEKVLYTATHAHWCVRQPNGVVAALTGLLEQDPVTALFYAAYGLNDLLGAAVFATAMTKAYGEQKVD
eukprot:COSAG02_NODE_669_length_18681_cov_170.310499_15_plen_147_part_00